MRCVGCQVAHHSGAAEKKDLRRGPVSRVLCAALPKLRRRRPFL